MTDVARISSQETEGKVKSGDAILVCAYGNDEKFAQNHLAGAISLAAFQAKTNSLPKGQEIIFY